MERIVATSIDIFLASLCGFLTFQIIGGYAIRLIHIKNLLKSFKYWQRLTFMRVLFDDLVRVIFLIIVFASVSAVLILIPLVILTITESVTVYSLFLHTRPRFAVVACV